MLFFINLVSGQNITIDFFSTNESSLNYTIATSEIDTDYPNTLSRCKTDFFNVFIDSVCLYMNITNDNTNYYGYNINECNTKSCIGNSLITAGTSSVPLYQKFIISLNSSYRIDNTTPLIINFDYIKSLGSFNDTQIDFLQDTTLLYSTGLDVVTHLNTNYTNMTHNFTTTFTFNKIVVSFGIQRNAGIASGIRRLYFNATDILANELPACDLSFEKNLQCLNSSAIEFNYNLSCTDTENDSILYSHTTSLANYTTYFDFNDWQCSLICINNPNIENVKNNFVFLSGSCKLNEDILNHNDSLHNMVLGVDLIGDTVQMLQLNGECSGEKALYLDTKTLSYSTNLNFEAVWGEETSFNLSYLDSNLNDGGGLFYFKADKFINVFNPTPTNRTLYYRNGTTLIKILNFTTDSQNARIRITNAANPTIWEIKVTTELFGETMIYNTIIERNLTSLTRYFKFSAVGLNSTAFPWFEYSTNIIDFDWQTTPGTSLEKRQPGSFNEVFYVTDDINENLRFKIYNQIIRVYPNSSIFCGYSENDFLNTTGIFTEEIENYFDTLDLKEELSNFLWIMFFFITLAYIIFCYRIKGIVDFQISTFLAALICFIAAWLTKSPVEMAGFLIIGALSLSTIIVFGTR